MAKGGRTLAVAAMLVGLTLLVVASPRASSSVPHPTAASSVTLPTLVRQGLVLPMGDPSGPDGLQVGYPSVLVDRGVYKMWYFEVQASPWYAQIAYATSADGRAWTKRGAVLSPSLPQEFNDVAYPTVVLVGGTYWMWYMGWDGSTDRIFAATSLDGVTWTKHGVALDVGPAGSQDQAGLAYPFVLYENGTFTMWYTGLTSFSPPGNAAIMAATSGNGLNWTKEGVVLSVGPAGSLDAYNVQTSGVVHDGSTFVMLYTGISADTTSRLFWATSADGLHWTKLSVALAPDPPREDSAGTGDPVILADGTWMVYYTVRNYTSDIQIYLASSSSGPNPPASPGAGPAANPLLAALTGWAPPAVVLAAFTALGGAVGAGVGLVASRPRPRRPG